MESSRNDVTGAGSGSVPAVGVGFAAIGKRSRSSASFCLIAPRSCLTFFIRATFSLPAGLPPPSSARQKRGRTRQNEAVGAAVHGAASLDLCVQPFKRVATPGRPGAECLVLPVHTTLVPHFFEFFTVDVTGLLGGARGSFLAAGAAPEATGVAQRAGIEPRNHACFRPGGHASVGMIDCRGPGIDAVTATRTSGAFGRTAPCAILVRPPRRLQCVPPAMSPRGRTACVGWPSRVSPSCPPYTAALRQHVSQHRCQTRMNKKKSAAWNPCQRTVSLYQHHSRTASAHGAARPDASAFVQ